MKLRGASMGMYDFPALRSATDRLWFRLAAAFARAGAGRAPRGLQRHVPIKDGWRNQGLLFSQTCGYPLTHEFSGTLRYLATPVYDVPGCEGPFYSSAILVRANDPADTFNDLRGRVLAVNGWDSQSGVNCLRPLAAAHAESGRFFGAVRISGGHAYSIAMVKAGQADVCAADAVSFALISETCPERVAGLRVLQWSLSAPSLPYVTSRRSSPRNLDRLRAALLQWIADPALASARQRVRLSAVAFLPLDAYQVIPAMRRAAEKRGYWELHAPSERPSGAAS